MSPQLELPTRNAVLREEVFADDAPPAPRTLPTKPLAISNLVQSYVEPFVSLRSSVGRRPGVTVTTLFPTPDGLKQIVLKDDGTVVLSGGGSSKASSPASPTSPADEIEKLANLRPRDV